MKVVLVAVFVAFVCATSVIGAPLEGISRHEETPADIYQYYINIIGEVSRNEGLLDLWLDFEQPLQQQVDEWKAQCNSITPSELRKSEAAIATVQLINDFLRLAEARVPGIHKQIKEKVNNFIIDFDELEYEIEHAEMVKNFAEILEDILE